MTLRVRGIVAAHGTHRVLHGIDLDAGAGELVSVLGGSGSGKTTLLRVVAGLHRPQAGTVTIGGDEITGHPPDGRRVGLVPQEGALFAHLDVACNVGFGLVPTGWRRFRRDPAARAAARERVDELLDLVGLADKADRMPHQLSGGERQRVALVRALAPRPAVVLLDEPFSGLDAGLRAQVRAEVVAALRAAGSTGVLVTHDRQEALSVGDRVALLHHGLVEQAGVPRAVYDSPATLWVAGFVGDMTPVAGSVRDGRLHTALGVTAVANAGVVGEVIAVVRPEQLRLADPTDGAGVPARVETVEYLGETHTVVVRLGATGSGAVLRARTRGPWCPGAPCTVVVDGALHVLPRNDLSTPSPSW